MPVLCAALSFTACLVSAQAQAACSRSDVDYYLDKGFTHEQVTALCGDRKPPPRRSRRDRDADDDSAGHETRETEERRSKDEEIFFIQNALAVQNVELTPRKLEYTRKLCLAAGKTPDVEGRTKVCPDVRYRIHFKNLKVGGYTRKYYLFGRREIEVTGKIQHKMKHDFSEYPSATRRQLLADYKYATRKGATLVPVRQDVPIYQVIEILREYAHRATKT